MTPIGLRDKNGKALKRGQVVLVPEPSREDDAWQHEFQGRVHGRKGNTQGSILLDGINNLVTIIDQEDNWWDVECERLIIISGHVK